MPALIRAENLASVMVAGLYGVSVPLFFPAYLHNVFPILQTIYLPASQPWAMMLTPSALFWVLAAAQRSC